MNNLLSERINSMQESATLKMAKISRELRSQGHDVIDLSIGEPDFDTPQSIKEAAIIAINEGKTKYTPVAGITELRQAIKNKFYNENNLNYAINEILVCNGGKQAIFNAMQALLNDGDEVIIPAPFWVSYLEILKLAGGVPVIIDTTIENDFKITAEELKAHITPKTRMMMFSTPCNPTGSVYSKQELRAIADVVKQHDELYIMSDEIYEHINFVGGHESMAQFPDIKDRVITINGVSKGFAMTGWRGGIMAAPKWIAQACDKMQGQFTSGTCSITQKAMHAAMLLPAESTHYMRDAFLKRRNLVLELMKDIPGFKTNVPDGAFYVYPEVSALFGKSHNGFVINNATDSLKHMKRGNSNTIAVRGCHRCCFRPLCWNKGMANF